MNASLRLLSLSLASLLCACLDESSLQVRSRDAFRGRSLALEPLLPFEEGLFPCSDCHFPELPVNTTPRALEVAHAELVFDHYSGGGWCFVCHPSENRDELRLVNGIPIAFEDSHKLCGQCHGQQLREWSAGLHGRRDGVAEGEAPTLRCVHCHDAHTPRSGPHAPPPRTE